MDECCTLTVDEIVQDEMGYDEYLEWVTAQCGGDTADDAPF